MKTEEFIKNLRDAFNHPNSLLSYVVFILLVLAIAALCKFLIASERNKKDSDSDGKEP